MLITGLFNTCFTEQFCFTWSAFIEPKKNTHHPFISSKLNLYLLNDKHTFMRKKREGEIG